MTEGQASLPVEYGLNVTRWLADHPGHVLMAGKNGAGLTAQRKDGRGRGRGAKVTALTLDELAAKLAGQEQGRA